MDHIDPFNTIAADNAFDAAYGGAADVGDGSANGAAVVVAVGDCYHHYAVGDDIGDDIWQDDPESRLPRGGAAASRQYNAARTSYLERTTPVCAARLEDVTLMVVRHLLRFVAETHDAPIPWPSLAYERSVFVPSATGRGNSMACTIMEEMRLPNEWWVYVSSPQRVRTSLVAAALLRGPPGAEAPVARQWTVYTEEDDCSGARRRRPGGQRRRVAGFMRLQHFRFAMEDARRAALFP